MRTQFDRIKEAAGRDPSPPWSVRKRRLDSLLTLLHDNGDRFGEAISADFGHRSPQETQLLELFPSLEAARHALRHGAGWMRDERRSTSVWFLPGSSKVVYQPLGVVGIIAPWNYPLYLAAGPLVAALAAGNRAMLKLSEFTPRTAELFDGLLRKAFADDEVVVVHGDAAVAAEFSRLPFDHLLFTGSTAVGRHVMHAAAENLTPVTLELGGKSPAIIGPDAALDHAAERIIVGKMFNAGQTCIAPDYVLVPEDRLDSLVAAAKAVVARLYPDLASTTDYSAIVNARHYDRLAGYAADARSLGATLVPLSNTAADQDSRRMPPVALLGVTDGMRVMQDEIFGPLLPLVPYRALDDAIRYVAARPRPLALYYFGRGERDVERVLRETHSGGVTINDVILHIAQDDLPFGGVGPSGIGHYHGRDGFLAFSKAKGVFRQARLNGMGLFNPPYGQRFAHLVRLLLR
ncbi:MAG: coniferyl aldehyde dehydrogenase [Betaproteobacteria bacterium]|nr:coniferyl aldehyde dehydrogenase [Betaproteobacteria bacterium]